MTYEIARVNDRSLLRMSMFYTNLDSISIVLVVMVQLPIYCITLGFWYSSCCV